MSIIITVIAHRDLRKEIVLAPATTLSAHRIAAVEQSWFMIRQVGRRYAIAVALLLLSCAAAAQERASASALLDEFRVLSTQPGGVDSLWQTLTDSGALPYAAGQEALFLFRGEAVKVAIAGDHTGWQRAVPLERLKETDLWWRLDTFPEDARIDYKLVVDDDWILDPGNPHVQVSGFGPNSELRMPAWHPSPFVARPAEGIGGSLSDTVTLASEHLGHALNFRVYTPGRFYGVEQLPVVYFTDGHEYAAYEMGAAVTILDNLIHERAVERALAVFIDPRVDNENLREELYLGNPAFVAFIAEELIPWLDRHYHTRADRESRVLVGTSFGGLFAAYAGATRPDVFGKLVIQSPALWPAMAPDWSEQGSIFDLLASLPPVTLGVYLTSGTVNDGADHARRLAEALREGGQDVTYYEVNEGHSWGNWRNRLPDALRALLRHPN